MKKMRSVLLTSIGTLGVFATILTMNNPMKSKFLIVFFILIILGIISFLIDSIFPNYRVWKLGDSAKQLGITKIYPNGNSGKKMSISLRNAKFIRIFSTSAVVFIRTYKDELTYSLSNNCLIRVMIVKPTSPVIFETEQAESTHRIGQIKDELKQVEGILRECIDNSRKLNNNNTGKIEIGSFNTQIRIPMIICDDNYGWTTLTLSPKRSSQSTSLELKNVNEGLLVDCINHFDNIWRIIHESTDIKVL